MATITTKTETLVGKRIRRKEDPRLITGTATYVDDIKLPGMHHACILRSPHAAAGIKSIDATAALALPGVVAVFTGADIGGVGPVPCGASLPSLRIPPHSILATDRVYFVGHPVTVAVDPVRRRCQSRGARVVVKSETRNGHDCEPLP